MYLNIILINIGYQMFSAEFFSEPKFLNTNYRQHIKMVVKNQIFSDAPKKASSQ